MKLRPGFATRKVPAMPTFFGAGTFAATAGSSAVNAPANDQANDILLLVAHCDDNDTLTGATGYAHVTGSPVLFGTSLLNVMWKRATDGSNDIASLSAPDGFQGAIIALRGVKTEGNPWTQISADTQATGTAISIPGVTCTENNQLIVVALAHEILAGAGAQASAGANASLASFTERVDDASALGDDGGVVVFTGQLAAEGSSGTTTLTLAATSPTGRIVMSFNSAI